ncbi:hypothetical protein [Streptomyces sp. NBC_01431]|uniref:hypothetical protein n=1 Tax=Streptomyces sp. NBC_01431 TaxID=2903863 RepID=UPI002E363C7F|nr:hypothetical protein [Streptomyces sp. NBC_01431]
MGDIEYRCTVRAALRLDARHVEILINSHGTPSPVLAASWLGAQVRWCVGALGSHDPSGGQLQAWLENDTAQWALLAALTAGQSAHVRICHGTSTVELCAQRVVKAPAVVTP